MLDGAVGCHSVDEGGERLVDCAEEGGALEPGAPGAEAEAAVAGWEPQSHHPAFLCGCRRRGGGCEWDAGDEAVEDEDDAVEPDEDPLAVLRVAARGEVVEEGGDAVSEEAERLVAVADGAEYLPEEFGIGLCFV